jgi:hypothetical protein
MTIPTVRRRKRSRGPVMRTECADRERSDLAIIALGVIEQTKQDLRSEGELRRAEARAFVDSEDFLWWCSIASLAPGRVRAALLEQWQ